MPGTFRAAENSVVGQGQVLCPTMTRHSRIHRNFKPETFFSNIRLRRAVFCYNTRVPSMAELWCNGEKSNAPRIDLASTLTSRSTEILLLFLKPERCVSDDAPVWAHCLFRVFWFACRRASVECMERRALFFMHARLSQRQHEREA